MRPDCNALCNDHCARDISRPDEYEYRSVIAGLENAAPVAKIDCLINDLLFTDMNFFDIEK
jgi:hypothetical protein